MNPNKEFAITVKEKILLHLLGYSKFADAPEAPPEVTQQGIARSINALRPHVSMALKDLRAQTQISERQANIINGKRKQKVYFIEPEGTANALAVKDKVGNLRISVRDKAGATQEQKIVDISKDLNLDFIGVLNLISHDNMIDLTITSQKPIHVPVPTLAKPKAPPPSKPAKPSVTTPAIKPQVVPGAVSQPAATPPVQPAAQQGYPQQQYPYPYYYPPGHGYHPEEIPGWYQERLIKNNKILFSAGYILLALGALFGILFLAHESFIELFLGIILIILGIVMIPVATFELWRFEDLRRNLLTLVTFTILIIVLFFYFAISEVTTDSEPVVFKYEVLNWFVIAGTFFGIIIFGKFIPRPKRATIGRVLGIALCISVPIQAIINTFDLFTAIFGMIIAMALIYVGNELSITGVRPETMLQTLKAMHYSIALGIGLGIIMTGATFIIVGVVTTLLQYIALSSWFAIGIMIFFVSDNYTKKLVEGLILALPIYIAILLVFFGIFLLFYNKNIEGLIEIILAIVIVGYSYQKIFSIATDKYTISLISLFLVAEILSLLQFLV